MVKSELDVMRDLLRAPAGGNDDPRSTHNVQHTTRNGTSVKSELDVMCDVLRVPAGGNDDPRSTHNVQHATHNGTSGFTLIELIIVMAIIAILTAIAVPVYKTNVQHAREAVLKEDLHTIRGAIDQFTYDKQKAPQSGDDLVQSGYLAKMPDDPFTHRNDTWIFDEGSTLTSIDETQGGIDNVHSGSQGVSTESTSYATW